MRRARPLLLFLVWTIPLRAGAQELNAPDDALDDMNYASLTADDRAQLSLGGFRRYLERIHATDEALYGLLDPRLASLETRELSADVVFFTATGLSVGALVAAIPVYSEVGLDESLALVIAAGGTFLLGVIIQAILRPGQQDLVALIDMHDQQVGRR